MKNTVKKWAKGILAMALAMTFVGTTVPAQTVKDSKEVKKQKKVGRDEVREAAKAFQRVMNVPDRLIPRELLEKAEAIGVFPNVVKAGNVIVRSTGGGVVSRRTPNGWSAPVFYNIGGSIFAPKVGAIKTDYIMLFTNEDALLRLLDDKIEFKGSLSFAAEDELADEASVLIYSLDEGVYAGESLNGVVLTADNSINEAFYSMKASEVLNKPESVEMTTGLTDLQDFSKTVRQYAKRQIKTGDDKNKRGRDDLRSLLLY